MESNSINQSAKRALLFGIVMMLSSHFYAQIEISRSKVFHSPCFEFDNKYWVSHFVPLISNEAKNEGTMKCFASSGGNWIINYAWGDYRGNDEYNNIKQKHREQRNSRILYGAEKGTTLLELSERSVENFHLNLELWQEDACSSIGKTKSYFYIITLDTILNSCIHVNLVRESDHFNDLSNRNLVLKRELRPLKGLHLIRPSEFEESIKWQFQDKEYQRKARNEAYYSARNLKNRMTDSLYMSNPSLMFAELDSVSSKKFLEMYRAGENELILKEYYQLRLTFYEKRIEALKDLLKTSDFSLGNYYRLREQYYLGQFESSDFLNYLNHPKASNKASLFMSYLKMFIAVNDDEDIMEIYLDRGSLDSLQIAAAYQYNIDDLSEGWIRGTELEEVWGRYYGESLVRNSMKLINIVPKNMQLYHIKETDVSTETFVGSYLDANVILHSFYVNYKLTANGQWQDQIVEMPFNLVTDSLQWIGMFGNAIGFPMIDKFYFIIPNYFQDGSPNDYKFVEVDNTTEDSLFEFVCKDVVSKPSKTLDSPMFVFKEWFTNNDSIDKKALSGIQNSATDSFNVFRWKKSHALGKLAHKTNPSYVLYKRRFRINDLNHDGTPECYRYSISNGKLIDVDCYTLVNNEPVVVSREQAEIWLKGEYEFRTLVLYSQLRGE